MEKTYKYQGKTSATTGAISELLVAIDLLSKCYHIFRSESPNSPCDLIAVKNNICIKIEVRTIARNLNGTIPQSAYMEREIGVVDCFAFVFKEDSSISYYNRERIAMPM